LTIKRLGMKLHALERPTPKGYADLNMSNALGSIVILNIRLSLQLAGRGLVNSLQSQYIALLSDDGMGVHSDVTIGEQTNPTVRVQQCHTLKTPIESVGTPKSGILQS
jgi:hypothetical protein